MNRSITDYGGNVLGFLVVIIVNGMANGVPIGGQTTGEISAKYPSLFTPAGYTFGIWGLIYLGLTIFVIWQALPEQRANQRLSAVHVPFLVSCAANASWIIAWHFELILLSVILMLVILGSLIQVYRRLDIGISKVPVLERLLVHLPFSIYTGWISIATIANLSAWQLGQGWDDFGLDAETWTIIKIAVAGSLAATVLFRRRDIAFVLVAAWASLGIAVNHQGVPLVAGGATTIALLGILLVGTEYLSRRRP